MKRITALWVAVAILATLFTACSMEKTEDDYVKDLLDKRTRANALLYVQEHKSRKAVPNLLYLLEKKYWTLRVVDTIGHIGDPVALPKLIDELKIVQTKDSEEHDRLTESLAVAIGRINDPQGVEPLISCVKNANTGPTGKSGCIQGLGLLGDKRGVPEIVRVLHDEKEKITIRHYAAIALGRIKAEEAAMDLVAGLFYDDPASRLNLFRDAQKALISIGGDKVREALIATYDSAIELPEDKTFEDEPKFLEVNPKLREWTINVDKQSKADNKPPFKPVWIRIKILNVLGELQDPKVPEFLVKEFAKGDDLMYEVFAKLLQAMERTPSELYVEALLKRFSEKPASTDYLNEKEIMGKVLIASNVSKPEDLAKIWEAAERGEVKLKDLRGQFQEFPQACVAAANVISMQDPDGSYLEKFDEFVKAGKCSKDLFGFPVKTKDLMAQFRNRLAAAKECAKDAGCWVKKLKDKEWGTRERAVYALSNLGDKTKMADLMASGVFRDKTEWVRYATLYATRKLAEKKDFMELYDFYRQNKLNKEFQRVTNGIGLYMEAKARDWGIDIEREVAEWDRLRHLEEAKKKKEAEKQ